MSGIIGSIIIAAFVGYQLDEVKIKKYEMIDEENNIVKVQFSKSSKYSCPLSCNLKHYHYAKNITGKDLTEVAAWNIKSNKDINGMVRYDINGELMHSYIVIKKSRIPKNLPNVNLVDLND